MPEAVSVKKKRKTFSKSEKATEKLSDPDSDARPSDQSHESRTFEGRTESRRDVVQDRQANWLRILGLRRNLGHNTYESNILD